jgi:hypothetical protein
LARARGGYCSPVSAGCQKTQPLVGWPVTALAAALREAEPVLDSEWLKRLSARTKVEALL